VPMVTWEPWDPERGVDQPDYALARVVAGDHDDYIASYARQVRQWGGMLALRFAHELNAPIYPWSVGLNGNTEQDALDAWRHVQQVFAAEGADVVWVWAVNVSGEETVPYESFFPGDDDVDWVGLDGYNGGDALPWGGWRSPEELLGPDVDRLQELSDRPVVLTEVGSAEAGGDKAGWISELFEFCREAGVAGLVWFDYVKETDWRVNSSPEAAAAFRRAAGEAELAPSPELPERLR
jgi:beta-mannanase